MINVIIILYTESSISTYLYHHLTEKCGIIKKRTLKLYKELLLSLNGIWLSKINILKEKIKKLNDTLLNVFTNFIVNKIYKFDYKKPVRMNKEITLLLKKRSKLTKKYYSDLTDHNKNLMVDTSNEYIRLFISAKEKNLIRLSAKLEDPSTAPKTYWSILNRFSSNKKIPIIPPLLLDGCFKFRPKG